MAPAALPPAVAEALVARHAELAAISEPGPGVTRLFATPEHLQALELVRGWMEAAGMTTRLDAAGNLIGRYAADPTAGNDPRVLLLGSHHDTVRQGGRYDGAMGVLLGIACVEALAAAGRRLPYHLDIVCFSDEEGTRYGTSMIGSRAVAGVFDEAVLDWPDADGITMRDAMARAGFDPDAMASCRYEPARTLGYVEAHIEQGPVLEAEDLPVGVVTAIAVGSRFRLTVTGTAGHAGTVPMGRRRDALTAAAEMILACERVAGAGDGVVATTGKVEVSPGAINVIPGSTTFTLDLRAPDAERHDAARDAVIEAVDDIAARRGVRLQMEQIYRSSGCAMDDDLRAGLGRAVAAAGYPVRELFSGAGHDALSLRHIAPVGMLFVRCKDGISHNPAEDVLPADIVTAGEVLVSFLADFAPPTTG
ncbi:MAG: allantoate amidohydrolase [Deinococcus-Thermus bacterium]|jgi:allantoate deiminase|nr:allantoate amidohydrolase [Deinococcota bacterium]